MHTGSSLLYKDFRLYLSYWKTNIVMTALLLVIAAGWFPSNKRKHYVFVITAIYASNILSFIPFSRVRRADRVCSVRGCVYVCVCWVLGGSGIGWQGDWIPYMYMCYVYVAPAKLYQLLLCKQIKSNLNKSFYRQFKLCVCMLTSWCLHPILLAQTEAHACFII